MFISLEGVQLLRELVLSLFGKEVSIEETALCKLLEEKTGEKILPTDWKMVNLLTILTKDGILQRQVVTGSLPGTSEVRYSLLEPKEV